MFTRFLALVVTVLVMSVTEAQPVVTFGSDSVTVAGLTPGARVVSYGVLREAVGYRQRVTHGVSGVLDEDRNGEVEVMSGRHVPWHTVFVVVDSTNGASAVAGPRAELFATSRERLTPGQVRKIVRAGSFAAFLLVRPGVGAWSLTIEDSGTNDDDTTPDGQLGLELHRMVPVGEAPSPPRTFERSDVLFAIDPATLSVVEWRAE
jgi:hypothetical protein